MRTIFTGVLLLAVASLAMASDWSSCGTHYDRLVTKNVHLQFPHGEAAHAPVHLRATGMTDLHVPLESGAWSVRVYELGHAHPVATFTGDLLHALNFPDLKNTTFALNVDFLIPKPTTSGKFIASLTAQDQSHSTMLCIESHFVVSSNASSLIAPSPSTSLRVQQLDDRVHALEKAVALTSGDVPQAMQAEWSKCGVCHKGVTKAVEWVGCGQFALSYKECLPFIETAIGALVCAALVFEAKHVLTEACERFTSIDTVADHTSSWVCSHVHLC